MLIPTHFLIIAVEEYNNPEDFPNVDYALKDAKEIKEAFITLGYEEDSFIVLLNNHATKVTIEREIKKIVNQADESERIVIYFSGHGLRGGGHNFLASVDASHEDPDRTCVKLGDILGTLERANCQRNLLFLDCCHSGFVPSEGIRSSVGRFSSDELLYELKDATYCAGFASCQGSENSISSKKIQNGVWSHFLIKALTGQAGDIYENGVLTSANLQKYLKNETLQFIKKHKSGGKSQRPIQFGSQSEVFAVESLVDFFKKEAARRSAETINIRGVEMYDTERGGVKDLPMFNKKKGHFIPDSVSDRADAFIKEASGDTVSDEISEIVEELQDKMDYVLADLDYKIDPGFGYVETPDFIYSVLIYQSKVSPDKYVLKRSIEGIVDGQIVMNEQFNSVFEQKFRKLSFKFNKELDVKDFITKHERAARKAGIKFKYAIGYLEDFRIVFPDTVNEIIVKSDSIEISAPSALSPKDLLNEFKDTKELLLSANFKLLD
ncbi:MAG: hypothetical protein BGO55_20635 [Sphingobacteriales bacterium 50-39]|nr:caspase family protein [Sphingobacteriales bacterium]OJW59096.1 MAG: hypothetical protein BGO55_20635 [Sphingobacteriales bacterium 50-39]